MSNQRVIKNSAAAPLAQRQLIAVGAGGAADSPFEPDACGAARVECIREGTVVRRIEVHCACGRVLQLVCDYAGDVG
jgi:hypothetical protein